MADSDSTPRRRLPRGADKLPPDFHAVDTRPEGARETDEYEATHSAASKLFDLRYLIGGLFTVYGIMLTVAGSSPDADKAKAADININLWLGLFMLLIGIFFLVWARLSPQKPPEPNLTGTDRPTPPPLIPSSCRGSATPHPGHRVTARARQCRAAAVPAITMPNPLKAAAT